MSLLSKHKRAASLACRSGEVQRILASAGAVVDFFNETHWPDQWSSWRIMYEDALTAAGVDFFDPVRGELNDLFG